MTWDKDRVQELRRQLGLTQMEFAHLLGCRQQTVSEWELGAYVPANAYGRLLDQIQVQVRLGKSYAPSRAGASPTLEIRATVLSESPIGATVLPESRSIGHQVSGIGNRAGAPTERPHEQAPKPATGFQMPDHKLVVEFDEIEFDRGFDPAID